MGTLDGEGIVIDCSRPNTVISTACDSESSSVHIDQMGGNTRRLLRNSKDPRSSGIPGTTSNDHFTRSSHTAFPPHSKRADLYCQPNNLFFYDSSKIY